MLRHSLFLLFFALLIFLFNSAILASMHLDLFRGCRLSGAPRIGSIVTLGFTDSSLASDSLSFSFILLTSLFMDLIFFLLNLSSVLSNDLVILFFKAPIWDFRLLLSASRLLNFLASLESLFCLRFSCLLVRGASSVVMYYTLAHFRWKPHIFQKNGFSIKKWFLNQKNGKLYIFNFMAK